MDAANSYLLAIDRYDQMGGEAFNVGDRTMNYTKRDVARIIRRHVDYYLHEADLGEDLDKRDYEVSYDKINQLGFRAGISLDEGVAELIKVLRHIRITNEWRNV